MTDKRSTAAGTLTRRGFGRGAAGAAAAGTVLAAPRAKAAPITLKMWMHLHPPRIPVDKEIIAGFEKANPGIKVDYQVIAPSNYAQKLLTAFAAGAGPDFFNWSSAFMAQWHQSGITAPVDVAAMGYTDQKALTSQYLSGFAGAEYGSTLYGVPSEVSNWCVYANNRIWNTAHLDPASAFPKTWEGMKTVASELTQRDKSGHPTRRGFDFDWENANIFYLTISTMMHQLGIDIIDETKNEANLDTPEARQVMQFYADWTRTWKLGGPQYIESRIAFLDGQMGAEGTFGIWGIPQMEQAKLDFSVHPAPRFAKGTNVGFDAYAFYMMANARSPKPVQQAAWKMARAYVDHAPELFERAGLFVPRQDVIDTQAFKTNRWAPVFLDELKIAKFSPRVVQIAQVEAALVAGRDQVLQGGAKVAGVMADLNRQVNQILKGG